MKKVSVIFLIFALLFSFAGNTYAFGDGLLYGKTMIWAPGYNVGGEGVLAITDGDLSTYQELQAYQVGATGRKDHAYYTFPSDVTITGFRLKSDSNVHVIFLNSSDSEVARRENPPNDGRYVHMGSVKFRKVYVYNSSNQARKVFEFEIYTQSQLPAVPTGLKAVGQANRIVLTWNASPDALDGYYVYRNGVRITDVPVNLTQYIDTDVEPDVIYTYQVTAVNGVDESNRSNSVTASLYVDEPPAPPTGLKVTLEHSGNLGFSWNPNKEPDIHHYNLYVDGVRIRSNITSTSIVIPSNEIANGLRNFYVTAVDNAGQESGPSNTVSIEVQQKLIVNFVPNGDAIVVQVISGVSPYTVTWEGEGVYNSDTFSASQYTISGLEYEKPYQITIIAANGDEVSKIVNTGKFKSFVPPVFPDPISIFQRMIDSFGTSGMIAKAIITAAVALGVVVVLGIWAWRLAKRWMARTR